MNVKKWWTSLKSLRARVFGLSACCVDGQVCDACVELVYRAVRAADPLRGVVVPPPRFTAQEVCDMAEARLAQKSATSGRRWWRR